GTMAIDTGTNSSNDPSSINSVFGHMVARQTALEENRFFQYLLINPPHEWLVSRIPGMSFWVQVTDPPMLAIAKHIKAGDVGPDSWFVRDIRTFGLPLSDIEMPVGPSRR